MSINTLSKFIPIAEPMLCEPAAAQSFLLRCAALAEPQASGILQMLMGESKAPQAEIVGRVGVVPLKGYIGGMGLGTVERALGMTDLNDFTANFRAMEANPEVKRILLDVDSPGGSILGVEEAAAMVRNSRKPVEAFGTRIGSAALWIAGAARKVHGLASGEYGSIGAVAIVTDSSEALKNAGVKVHRIASGIYKGAFAPGAPVTDEHLAMAQEQIGEIASNFKKQLRLTRSTIPDSAMEGQSFRGKKAASLGIITGIVGGRDEVLARMNG